MTQFNLSITLEYDIITAQDDIALVAKVNERLQSGNEWEPLGGVISHRGVLCQAIVRERPEEPVDHTIVRRGRFTFKDVGGLYVKVRED